MKHLLSLWLFSAAVACSICGNDETPEVPLTHRRPPGQSVCQVGRNDEDLQDPEVPWELMFAPGDERIVTAVTLKIEDDDVDVLRKHFGLSLRLRSVDVESFDPVLLELAKFAFRYDQCLRRVVPAGGGGGWSGGGHAFGELTIATTRGAFTLRLTLQGFALNSQIANTRNSVFSPGGAEFVSVLYEREAGTLLPIQLTRALSGARLIDEKRRNFHDLLLSGIR